MTIQNLDRPSQNVLASDLEHILLHTRYDWEQMRGQRIFITGATGFFGCWLLESFTWINDHLALSAEATILTRSPAAFARRVPHLASHPAIKMMQGDVRDFDFPPGEHRFVIHAAADSDQRKAEADPEGVRSTIVEGTRRALDFARTCGAQSFLFTSSGAVYGRQPEAVPHVAEDYPLPPAETLPPYAAAKRVAEDLCTEYFAGTQVGCKIARCFAFVGPYVPLDASFAAGNFIRDALHGVPVQVAGDGSAVRSYLYGADLAIWLWVLLFRGPTLQPLNVGSERAVTIRELAEIVVRTLNPNSEVRVAREYRQGSPRQLYVPSTLAARKTLGLAEYVPLQEAVLRTARWYGYGGIHGN